ncbi:conserved hypothetical protein [delta proteobacterium NaphS2]|nr:conserved hypothetical protein [delta proteobacterium NaphS2]
MTIFLSLKRPVFGQIIYLLFSQKNALNFLTIMHFPKIRCR